MTAGIYGAVCVAARLAGFDHVSDDDFARVTIAQAFAHAPKLDPSGTSWLPFPFWVTGAAMAVFGRSLASARAIAIVLASAAAAAPLFALRASGVPRGRSAFALAVALGTPWSVWLGASTVPESFTASLTAAGAIGLAASSARADRSLLLPAAAILAATLSRYEPWPVAAVLAIALAVSAARDARPRRSWLVAAAAICVAGPLLWMAWNAHAHDGPLHFFRRVSTYKRAIGDGATDIVEALLLYPKLLFATRPELAIPALFLLLPAMRDPSLWRRWALPLACAAAQIAFLAYGNARDGAPAHHPERALLGATVLLGLFVGDAGPTVLRELASTDRRPAAIAGIALFSIAWTISTIRGLDMPGRGTTEDRSEAIARGEQLRANDVSAFVVTPCAYEHFALIAAYGAPERVEVKARGPDRWTEACPEIELRE